MNKIILIATTIIFVMNSNKTFAQFEKINIEGLNDLEYKNIRSAWGDLNNDGFEDVILISSNDQSVKLLYNNQDGGFLEDNNIEFINRTASYTNAILADFNNDGFLDVFFTTSGNSSIPEYDPNILYKNNGDGTFTDVTEGLMAQDESLSISASWGDINNDGYLDLFVSNISFFVGELNFLYVNNGDGTFEKINAGAVVEGQYASSSSHWIDINNDEYLDLVILNQNFRNQVFINNQDLTFTEDVQSALSGTDEDSDRRMVWLDINLDGYLEPIIFNGNNNNVNKTFLNNTDGTFSLVNENQFTNTNYPSDVIAEDLNNDGFVDLVMASDTEENYIFYGTNSNEFERETNVNLSNGSSQASDVAVPDITNNGLLDIHFSASGFDSETNADDQDFIFQNTNNSNNWNRFSLRGTNSNRYGVGSKILAYSNGEIVGHQQIISDGFTKSNLFAHFGLNQINRLDSIMINWAGSESQIIRNVRTNLINTINQNEEYNTPEPPEFQLVSKTNSSIEINITNLPKELAVLEISENGTDFNITDTISSAGSYVFTELNENTEYFIKAISLGSIQYSFDSQILSTTTNINQPELTAVNVSNSSAEVFWIDNTEFEDNYVITINSDGIDKEYIAERNSESFVIEDLSENISFNIKIKAIADEGTESAFSNEIDGLTLLNPPSNLSTELSDVSIILTWDNNSEFSTGFILERSTTEDFQNAEIFTLENQEYEDTDIQINTSTTYFYRVKAVNDDNESDFNEGVNNIITSTEQRNKISFQYKNPTKNIIKINGLPEREKIYRIYDTSGRLLMVEKSINNTVNISILPSQLYWVQIQIDDKLIDFKILKD